jgi:hypothetical protein
LTIIALIRQSLANLRRKSAKLEGQKALSSSERSYGFLTTLLAARMQEAELLVSGYIQRPGNTAVEGLDRQLKGWTFHR